MEASRLTERNDSGGITVKDAAAALAKLAELEDAEEQGRMILCPCSLGKTVYTLASQNGPINEWRLRDVTAYSNHEALFYIESVKNKDNMSYFILEDIGNWVYLTREEAEAALKGCAT